MTVPSRLTAAQADRYRMDRELGGGGMSRVFLATELALGREVVVKVVGDGTGVSADRFAREVQLAARLQQANIVPLLTAGDADGLPYYTMPCRTWTASRCATDWPAGRCRWPRRSTCCAPTSHRATRQQECRAMCRRPGWVWAHGARPRSAFCFSARGDLAEAMRERQLARRLDPLAATSVNKQVLALIDQRRWDEARTETERLRAMRPLFTLSAAFV